MFAHNEGRKILEDKCKRTATTEKLQTNKITHKVTYKHNENIISKQQIQYLISENNN